MRGWTRTLLTLGLLAMATGCAPPKQPRERPLYHSAYLWKQGWDPRTAEGLRQTALPSALQELTVLVGECGLGPSDRPIRPPWDILSGKHVRIALCVRIGVAPGQKNRSEADLGTGLSLLRRGLTEARAAGITVAALQVDYDCPERLLASYARQIREFKATVSPLPVTITAVPSWLDARDLPPLLEAADGWTLQVHATERPSLSRPVTLFSAKQSARWIDRACRLGKPFRVALPTYSYLACFSDHGVYLGVRAEMGDRPTGTARAQPLAADPEEVVALLRRLDDQRYALVEGIAWFRLPLPGERQNWTSEGLAMVIAGRPTGRDLRVEIKTQGPLHDVIIHNPSQQPLPLPSVDIRWQGAAITGADGTLDWEARPTANGLRYVRRDDSGFLAPGERRVVGWLRLASPVPVTAAPASE